MQYKKANRWRIKTIVTYFLIGLATIIYISFIPSAAFYYNYCTLEEMTCDLEVPASSDSELPKCPLIPENLDRWTLGDFYSPNDGYIKWLWSMNESSALEMKADGLWKPSHCVAQHKVAIIIPYRNRAEQLQVFLRHMHQFLKPQLIEYRIIVIEQIDTLPFNRGALFNVGYKEALKLDPKVHCFIFHDVDLLPMNGANLYACSRVPRHMSVSVNTFRFNLPFTNLFGGVVAITAQQFQQLNGFSNRFYGWGGEDDDMFNRIVNKKLEISRWSPAISRYHMLPHSKEVPNRARFRLLREGSGKFDEDGLNNLAYDVVNIQWEPLCIFISISFHDASQLA